LDASPIKIYGECCRPWSKGANTREQGSAWPDLGGEMTNPPCNDIPDIQDPTSPLGPWPSPPKKWTHHHITFSIKDEEKETYSASF